MLYAHKCFFVVPLICSLFVVAYGYYEAGQIKTERLIIKTDKIPKEIKRLKIVQISDIHVGLIIRQRTLEKIASEIRKINPDILVSTGDIVDGQINHLNEFIDPLKSVNPPYGKFAVTGNHEFYAGIESSLDFMRKAGFTVLRGRSVIAGGIINIAGVDDTAGRPYSHVEISENVLLSSLPKGLFTVLLKHKPVIDRAAIDLFDLQLSGHTHKGQIFPFNFITRLFFPMYNGFFKLSDVSYLYVSRGSGTWGPPVRFLAPPEITVIELVYASN
ncbi:MAG: metallophosphoesterase [Proteobacteria bacterium]|nr:metallophosphoesterase [Pseudomonadota bacterium]